MVTLFLCITQVYICIMVNKYNYITVAMVMTIAIFGHAMAAAPGDEDSDCIVRSHQNTYQNTWKVLMDSFNYKEIIHSTKGTWKTFSVDGDSNAVRMIICCQF